MAVSNSGTLFFTNDGNTLLLVEKGKVFCWDFQTRALQFSLDGELIGLSHDNQMLCLQLGRAFQCYALPTGKKIDPQSIKPEAFAWHQRAVMLGQPNAAEIIMEDVFDRQRTRKLPLDGHMTATGKLVRVYASPYLMARTWWDTGYSEGVTLGCYNVETGEQVLRISSNGNCPFGVTWAREQNALAIEECGHIKVYSLQTKQQRYDIRRPTNTNLRYHLDAHANKVYVDDYDNVVSKPQSIVSISLHPQLAHLLALATDTAIQLIDLRHTRRDIFKSWASGQVLQSIQGESIFRGMTFAPNGQAIVYISWNYELNGYVVASDEWTS